MPVLPAQVFQCVSQASGTPSVGFGEQTAQLGDVILICAGGATGAQHTTDVLLDVGGGFRFTSRVNDAATLTNEAVMLVNEPLVAQVSAPAAVGTYKQADNSTSYTRMRFAGVTMTEPGPSGTNVYRFTNLRVSVPTSNLTQLPVSVTVSYSNVSLPVNPNPVLTLAVGMAGGVTSQMRTANGLSPLSAPVSLSRCLPNNLSLANAPGTASYTEGRTLTVRLSETMPVGLRKRGESTYVDGNTFPAIAQTPITGLPYTTQSMFWVTAAGWPKSAGNVPSGQANTGTRVFVKFTSVPSGVRIFGASNDQGSPNNASIKRVRAVAMHGTLGTAGPTAVQGLANTTIEGGLVESQLFGGARWLLYEMLPSIDNTSFETLDLPIVVAHKGGTAVGLGTMKVQAGLGPISALNTPDVTTTIPRYQDLSVAQNAVTIAACPCPYFRTTLDSKSYVDTNTAEFRLTVTNNTASPIYNLEMTNIRGVPASMGITSLTATPLVVGTLAPNQSATVTVRVNVPTAAKTQNKTLAYRWTHGSGSCSLTQQWGF
ncbi:MAG: hypothetical protein J0L64_21255 [Acidobacteria bacterium]|nr:hypothetical protein [Acidobacteriota bacterium]